MADFFLSNCNHTKLIDVWGGIQAVYTSEDKNGY